MTEQIEIPTDNVIPLPGSGQGRLTMPEGTELPVRTYDRGKEVVLVVLVDADEADTECPRVADLEYTSARGIVRLRGEAVWEDRSLIRFRIDGDADVLQRRDFVRVDAPTEVVVETDAFYPFLVHTVDVSGGGMLLTGADVLDPDETVNFAITLDPLAPPIEGVARVVRARETGERGLVFEQISEDDRQRLIRFVFECMRIARARTRGTW
jgi:hypothetical protein